MSVFAVYRMYCNGFPNGRPCLRFYEPPAGQDVAKPAALRRHAAADGWTHVPNPSGRRMFDKDFCPACKPFDSRKEEEEHG